MQTRYKTRRQITKNHGNSLTIVIDFRKVIRRLKKYVSRKLRIPISEHKKRGVAVRSPGPGTEP